MREFVGIDAVIMFLLMIAIGILNSIINAVFVTFIASAVTMFLVLIFPHWELAPWIKQHALSLFAGVFLLQFILPHRGVDSPIFKLPTRYQR